MDRFEALETFDCLETGSTYEKGMTYRIRKGNDALRKRVSNWLSEGKVAIVGPRTTATIVGTGEIK